MSELNYVPSWLDSAMTLLEKLNKCIEKIETIADTVVSVTKTANDALSLANTNEADITALETKTATLETKTATLETSVGEAKKEAHDAYSLAQLANSTANTAQAIANNKSPKLYLHQMTIQTPDGYRLYFWTIDEESKYYKNKYESNEQFEATLSPLGAKLLKVNNTSITKCLTLELSAISFTHVKLAGGWNQQNSNGAIQFAAYLNDNNQIVTIDNEYEWYAANILAEYVKEL